MDNFGITFILRTLWGIKAPLILFVSFDPFGDFHCITSFNKKRFIVCNTIVLRLVSVVSPNCFVFCLGQQPNLINCKSITSNQDCWQLNWVLTCFSIYEPYNLSEALSSKNKVHYRIIAYQSTDVGILGYNPTFLIIVMGMPFQPLFLYPLDFTIKYLWLAALLFWCSASFIQ